MFFVHFGLLCFIKEWLENTPAKETNASGDSKQSIESKKNTYDQIVPESVVEKPGSGGDKTSVSIFKMIV